MQSSHDYTTSEGKKRTLEQFKHHRTRKISSETAETRAGRAGQASVGLVCFQALYTAIQGLSCKACSHAPGALV